MSTTRKLLLQTLIATVILIPSAAMARVALIAPRPIPPIIEPPDCPPAPHGYYYRWIPPVYRTEYDRVWVEESTRRVLEWVEIAPGRYEQRWTTITIPAHYETVTRRVLVTAGYWELVRITPPPPVVIDPPIIIDPPIVRPMPSPGTVGVDGYSRGTSEDLSKFSPLHEWPDKK